jgi:hypothetical protein
MKLKGCCIVCLTLSCYVQLSSQALAGYLYLDKLNLNTVKVEALIAYKCPLAQVSSVNIDWGDGSPTSSLGLQSGFTWTSGCASSGIIFAPFTGTHSYVQGTYSISAGFMQFASGISNITNSSMEKLIVKRVINLQGSINPAASPVTPKYSQLTGSAKCSVEYLLNLGMTVPNSSSMFDSLHYSLNLHPEINGYVSPPFYVDIKGTIHSVGNPVGDFNISLKSDQWQYDNTSNDTVWVGTAYSELFISMCSAELGLSDEELEGQIRVFPNLVDDMFTIQGPEATSRIKIFLYSIIGTLLVVHEVQNGESVDLTKFCPGIYVVRLEYKGKMTTMKLIKNSQ